MLAGEKQGPDDILLEKRGLLKPGHRDSDFCDAAFATVKEAVPGICLKEKEDFLVAYV